MITSIKTNKWLHTTLFSLVTVITLLVSSCQKDNPELSSKSTKPAAYSSEVLQKWMNLQMRLMRNAVGIPNHALGRQFAYTGVAAYESLQPGIHGKKEWSNKWNGLTGLPIAQQAKEYYYPANVNAAMAAMNKMMFPNAAESDKAAIDSLEQALKTEFLATQSPVVIEESASYGKQVATAVYNWSESDGHKNANLPYVLPTNAGAWKPTPPAFAAPATPYWGNNRTVIRGSIDNTKPAPPAAYSEEAHSPFYVMAKEVFDVSKTLTEDQKAMATFWRDVPGATTPGHWLSILRQIVIKEKSNLEDAAMGYALAGSAINDAAITVFKWKYHYNVVRPVTYIRDVFGYTTWSPLLGTPAHPEYVSAHSSLSMATAMVLEKLFETTAFTDHTYDYLGLPARSYSNIPAIAMEAGQSRLYAGIHYQPSINAGIFQGSQVAVNIFKK